LVGSSLNRILSKSNKVTEVIPATRNDANLFNLKETSDLIKNTMPDVVINSAAKVGGIHANNSQRTAFITENLKINLNIIEALRNLNSIKLINLGSSCIYPLDAPNPIREDSLMTGALEPTNSPYAIAKISAIEMSRALNSDYGNEVVNLMPTNLYGPKDYFHEDLSHVIPGMIAKMHIAKIDKRKEFAVWGTGKPLREFLFVDDLALAIEHIIDIKTKHDLINIGSGSEVTILELALKIQETVGFEGKIIFDSSKPDGNPRKLLDSTIIKSHGWSPKTSLEEGLVKTYSWYLENISI
jgi:GDP-L-fucose synthase